MKRILLILVALLSFSVTFSQISSRMNYKKQAAKKNANYFEIVKSKRAEITKYNLTKSSDKKAYKHFERWAYYWKDRVGVDGTFPPENLGYFNAGIIDANGKFVSKRTSKNNTANKTQGTIWNNIGPSSTPVANGYFNFPQMGRLNSFYQIEKTPTAVAQNVLFTGAPDGGLWRSKDNGATWTPLLDEIAGIGVTDAQGIPDDTYTTDTNSKIIYVSTGDYDAQHINSIGVLKSTDGGDTFASTGLSFSLSQGKITSNLIVIDAQTVFVGTDTAIKRTVDGGATWTNVFTGTNTDDRFGRLVRKGALMVCQDQLGGIYLSSDTGATWTSILTQGNDFDKKALTIENTTIYRVDSTGQVLVWDTAAGTPSWINFGVIPDNTTTQGTNGQLYDTQGGYNATVFVKDGLIISNSVNGYSSTDNGATWETSLNGYKTDSTQPGNYIHSDHHGMGSLDNTANVYKFWSVNDGGLSFIEYPTKTELKPTITYKSDGVINTQLYSAAIVPNSTAGDALMGNQDNDGFSKEMHNGSMQWIAASAGDGTATAIDYNNVGKRYLGGTNGSFTATTSGFSGAYTGNLSLQSVPGAGFIWPLEMHTTDPTILYAGGDDVYKVNTSGGAHTALNAAAGQISYISTHGNNVFIVGATAVKKSIDSGANWTALTQASSFANINSLDFKSTDPNIVYATTKDYIDGDKVFKSTDGGTTWTNISGTLPNILVKNILLKQNESSEYLFVGTELGVYFKVDNGAWSKLGDTEFPNVIVNDMNINYTTDKLVVATFGRGLWEATIANATLGIRNFSLVNKNTTVYPNPLKGDYLNVNLKSYTNDGQDYKYIIYNVLGGVVKSGKLDSNTNQVDVSNIAHGIYIFKMAHGKEVSVKKIIKQ